EENADVVDQLGEIGLSAQSLGQEWLGTVVLLLGEIREPELECNDDIRRRQCTGLLQEGDSPSCLTLGHVHNARVIEGLYMVRLDLQSFAEIFQGTVVALVVELDDGLADVDVGLRALAFGRAGRKPAREQQEDEGTRVPNPHAPVIEPSLFDRQMK